MLEFDYATGTYITTPESEAVLAKAKTVAAEIREELAAQKAAEQEAQDACRARLAKLKIDLKPVARRIYIKAATKEVETNFTEEKDPKFENLCDEIKKEIKEEHKIEEWLSSYPLENHNAFSFFVEYDERGFVSRCKVAFFEEHSYNIIYNENTENKKVAALFDTTHEEHDKEVRSVAKIVFKLKNKGQLTKEEQDAKLEEAKTQRQMSINKDFDFDLF